MERYEPEGGSALVMVLAFGAVLLLLGGFLLTYGRVESQIARHQEEEKVLYYTAEAGLEQGLEALRQDYSFSQEMTGELGGKEYRVELEKVEPGLKEVTSTAEDRQEGKISLLVEAHPLYRCAAAAGESLRLSRAEIDGGAHYNRELRAEEGVNLVRGPVTRPPGAQREVEEGAELQTPQGEHPEEEVSFPEISAEGFSGFNMEEFLVLPGNIAVGHAFPAEKVLIQGDLWITATPWQEFRWEGILLVEGDIRITPHPASEVILEGTAAAAGDILVDPGAPLEGEEEGEPLRLLAGGELSLAGLSGEGEILFNRSLLLYTCGSLKLQGSEEPLKLRGAALAGKVLEMEGVKLEYCSAAWDETVEKILGNRVVIKRWVRP